ncbi:MAG: chromosomal replication initiator protein DnaA [Gammaproteobacteria bacterium]|nr:chromosomal replication initiator protein DnaA [Gammaproteobacteria bacterium]MYD75515.1 chromosomal replication initiator protein DnaA [Gammaproteobacteria bacterium]
MTEDVFWQNCLQKLRETLPEKDIDSWITLLHYHKRNSVLKLLAPNQYVLEHIRNNLLSDIQRSLVSPDFGLNEVRIDIGSYGLEAGPPDETGKPLQAPASFNVNEEKNRPNKAFTFENHIEGSSNHVARAAAYHVGNKPGVSYNPLFIYGGVGLGKTHLMHAAGNLIMENFSNAKVLYITSERFVTNLINALRNNSINEFKNFYRSLDTLLIDDIQFLARKTMSQEEFFHTYNDLLEGDRQIIITSDRIPVAINHIDERLISRFGAGLTVQIEPPELETRVAILSKKAFEKGIDLPENVAFFIANIVRSNVRDLEGALQQIAATARFTHSPVDLNLARKTFKDLLTHHQQQLSIENIQQTVAKYFNIRISDLFSKSRSRAVARPRQLAMYFCKEYTDNSYPSIGDKFGGRDHSTVIHACTRIQELIDSDSKMREDYENLNKLFGG